MPAFHKAWLERMVTEFVDCSNQLIEQLDKKIVTESKSSSSTTTTTTTNNNAMKEEAGVGVVDMEEKFCSVSLDIIGKCVFNYDFGSVTSESPIIQAVYQTLREAENVGSIVMDLLNTNDSNSDSDSDGANSELLIIHCCKLIQSLGKVYKGKTWN